MSDIVPNPADFAFVLDDTVRGNRLAISAASDIVFRYEEPNQHFDHLRYHEFGEDGTKIIAFFLGAAALQTIVDYGVPETVPAKHVPTLVSNLKEQDDIWLLDMRLDAMESQLTEEDFKPDLTTLPMLEEGGSQEEAPCTKEHGHDEDCDED